MLIKNTRWKKDSERLALRSDLKISVVCVNMFLRTILLQMILAKEVCFRQGKGRIPKGDLYCWSQQNLGRISNNFWNSIC